VAVGEFALLILAGVGAGLTGSTAGLASLISYPALLAFGLPAVTANVTNTVALVFSSLGSVSGSRLELSGQWGRARRLSAVGGLGGAAGGLLLLNTPADTFAKLVPVLIGLASVLLLVRRPPVAAHPHAVDPRWLTPAVFAIGCYGGYFGAAAGVLLLAAFLAALSGTLADVNALKNVVLGVANGVAALGFVLFADVRWSAAVPLAVGLFLGGRLGPAIVRRVPATPLRIVIAVAGVGLAVRLGFEAY
jgi:uncharacterized membrane protein YfcA